MATTPVLRFAGTLVAERGGEDFEVDWLQASY